MPMLFTDARTSGHPIIFVNGSLILLTGYTREEMLGQRLDFLAARETDSRNLIQIEDAFAAAEDHMEGHFRHKDGGVFRAALFISAVRDAAGDIVQHFISLVDLSKHEREEERLRFLLDELNHRTQNTLAIVQSIVLQTLRGRADREVVDTLEQRILALSRAHGLLGHDNWEAVPLREVLEAVLRPITMGGGADRISMEGSDARLGPKTTLALTLLLHELAANATSHGALSNGDGRIDVTWGMIATPDGERMRLQWREHGGPPVAPPTHKGFGSRLLDGGAAQDLHGEVSIDYAPTGLICTIVMPFSRAQAGARNG